MYNLQASLRPDYYEWFPNFSPTELRGRFVTLPPHLATLLTVRNITLAVQLGLWPRQSLEAYLKQSWQVQRDRLRDAMIYVGICPDAVAAICRVPRHLFAPERTRPYAYLNAYLPWDRGSGVSPPGMVALMLESLLPCNPPLVEIGIGTGFHAACIAERFDRQALIYGYESNIGYARFGQRALELAGYDEIKLLIGDASDHSSDMLKPFETIYLTAAFAEPLSLPLVARLPPKGVFQYIRALSSVEYKLESSSGWLRKSFPTYDLYLAGNWSDQYACMATSEYVDNKFTERSRIYDVAFVPGVDGIAQARAQVDVAAPFEAMYGRL